MVFAMSFNSLQFTPIRSNSLQFAPKNRLQLPATRYFFHPPHFFNSAIETNKNTRC
jgi:hypothetical protein